MDKTDDVIEILKSIDFLDDKTKGLNVKINTFLALSKLSENEEWSKATNNWTSIHEIIQWLGETYNVQYKENTRETIRKDALKPFRTAALVEDNGKPTNSPNFKYRLTPEALSLIRSFKTNKWESELANFKSNYKSLLSIYDSKRELNKIPVQINNKEYKLSSGKHSLLHKLTIEEFGSRFTPNAECLYLGDTAQKDLHIDKEKLQQLGFNISENSKLPDIILYSEDINTLFIIECVTSTGPMSDQRIKEIEGLIDDNKYSIIYITTFLNKTDFKKHFNNLAWETEVWIADNPDHMIHLNGIKFLRS